MKSVKSDPEYPCTVLHIGNSFLPPRPSAIFCPTNAVAKLRLFPLISCLGRLWCLWIETMVFNTFVIYDRSLMGAPNLNINGHLRATGGIGTGQMKQKTSWRLGHRVNQKTSWRLGHRVNQKTSWRLGHRNCNCNCT